MFCVFVSVFEGLHLMVFIGFGLLLTFLKKYGFSAMGYNFLISALVIEWATMMQGFFEMQDNKIHVGLERYRVYFHSFNFLWSLFLLSFRKKNNL